MRLEDKDNDAVRRGGIFPVFIALFVLFPATAATPQEKATDLLRRWSDGLIALQIGAEARPELRGGIMCPACGLLHGRICDIAYPCVHLFATTGKRTYLTAAERAVDWCEANMLLPTGLYRNDRQTYWRSTTAFFSVSLARALEAYDDRLPETTRAKWRAIFRRASAATYDLFENGFDPNVNYQCIYPLAMWMAWRESGEDRYRAAAKRKAGDIVRRFFNEEGLLVGEGKVGGLWEGKTSRGCQMVDLAYNLEESLAALLEYADLSGDADLRARTVESAKVHFEFVLPDGAIDDSCGSRVHKWTYYGSRTSDGILPLLALLRDDVPYVSRMADRVLDLYARCTGTDGLLRGGLMYDDAREPPCVHHSFARLKSLADFIRGGDFRADGRLPREESPRVRHFRSLDTYLAAVGPWRATLTANDACNTMDARSVVGGGTLSLLWHEAVGPVMVGTPGVFTYREPHNMQDDRHDMTMRCLAPRVVAGEWSNVFAQGVKTKGRREDDAFVYSASGEEFGICYRLEPDALRVSVRCSCAGARYLFPLVAGPDDRVDGTGRLVCVRRPDGVWKIESSADVRVDRTDRGSRIWSPVTGLMCVPFSVDLQEPVELKLTWEVE